MPLIFQKRIYREDLQANPNATYVFGDNEIRQGLGGQAAEMRFEPNAFGIPTKRNPGTLLGDYWSDADYDRNTGMLMNCFTRLITKLSKGETVVFPLDGIGTGLSDLPNKAPRTYAFIVYWMGVLKNYYGANK